jgi:hypothetical protein
MEEWLRLITKDAVVVTDAMAPNARLKSLRREYRQQPTDFESDIDRSALGVGPALRGGFRTFARARSSDRVAP